MYNIPTELKEYRNNQALDNKDSLFKQQPKFE